MRHHFPLLLSLLFSAGLLAGCHPNFDQRVTTLDGRRVEFATAGQGEATVVFEAGLGNDWTTWDTVAGKVAPSARVFAYSRPGYGASDPTTSPRDPEHIAEELRALLRAQGYAPPYVLVGHSLGGAYMELFAKAHPSEVAGLVLVDPRHRDFSAECAAAQLDNCGIPARVVASLPQVQIDEYQRYDMASAQMQAAGTFGAYPVRVLIATNHPPANAPRESLWTSLLVSLASEAADGEPIVFQGAGHVLHAERPDDVARAILAVLPEVNR